MDFAVFYDSVIYENKENVLKCSPKKVDLLKNFKYRDKKNSIKAGFKTFKYRDI